MSEENKTVENASFVDLASITSMEELLNGKGIGAEFTKGLWVYNED